MIIGLFFKILGVILFIGIIFVIFLWIKIKQFPLVIKSKDKNLPFAIGEEDKGGEGEGGGDAEKGEGGDKGGDKGGEEKNELKGRFDKNPTNSLNMLNNHSAQTYGSMAYPTPNDRDYGANTLLSSKKETRHGQSNKNITSNYLANQPRNAGNRFVNDNNLLGDPAEFNNMNNYLYNPMGVYNNLYNTSPPGSNYLMSYGQGINESGLTNSYDRPDLSLTPKNAGLTDKSDAKKEKKEKKSADSKKEGEELISPLNTNLTTKKDESDTKKEKKSTDSKKDGEELISPLNTNLTTRKDAMSNNENDKTANLAEANEVDMQKNMKEMLQESGDANLTDEKDKKKKKKSSKDNENDLVGTTNVQDVSLKEKDQQAPSEVQKSSLSETADEESEKSEKNKKKKGDKSKPKTSKLKEKLGENNLNGKKESKITSSNVAANKSSLTSTSKKNGTEEKETKHHGDSHHDEKHNEFVSPLNTSNLLENASKFGFASGTSSALLGRESLSSILASESF